MTNVQYRVNYMKQQCNLRDVMHDIGIVCYHGGAFDLANCKGLQYTKVRFTHLANKMRLLIVNQI